MQPGRNDAQGVLIEEPCLKTQKSYFSFFGTWAPMLSTGLAGCEIWHVRASKKTFPEGPGTQTTASWPCLTTQNNKIGGLFRGALEGLFGT